MAFDLLDSPQSLNKNNACIFIEIKIKLNFFHDIADLLQSNNLVA